METEAAAVDQKKLKYAKSFINCTLHLILLVTKSRREKLMRHVAHVRKRIDASRNMTAKPAEKKTTWKI
jgi:hypothetical protein